MSEFVSRFCLEIPSDVPQEEVWQLEERLKQIEGVTTDLRKPKSLLADTLLYLQLAASLVAPIVPLVEGIKSIHELAEILYGFIHKDKQHYNVTIRKNGTEIVIKDMTIEDLERLLSQV